MTKFLFVAFCSLSTFIGHININTVTYADFISLVINAGVIGILIGALIIIYIKMLEDIINRK